MCVCVFFFLFVRFWGLGYLGLLGLFFCFCEVLGFRVFGVLGVQGFGFRGPGKVYVLSQGLHMQSRACLCD